MFQAVEPGRPSSSLGGSSGRSCREIAVAFSVIARWIWLDMTVEGERIARVRWLGHQFLYLRCCLVHKPWMYRLFSMSTILPHNERILLNEQMSNFKHTHFKFSNVILRHIRATEEDLAVTPTKTSTLHCLLCVGYLSPSNGYNALENKAIARCKMSLFGESFRQQGNLSLGALHGRQAGNPDMDTALPCHACCADLLRLNMAFFA